MTTDEMPEEIWVLSRATDQEPGTFCENKGYGGTRYTRAPSAPKQPDGWLPIAEAPRDGTIIDVWLGDADSLDTGFYCTPGTKRSPAWHFKNGKFRPCIGLNSLTVFVEPTHWQPLPPPPSGNDGKEGGE